MEHHLLANILKHKYKMQNSSFIALDRIQAPTTGEDWDTNILISEIKWIYRLQGCVESSLNDAVSYKPFLQTD